MLPTGPEEWVLSRHHVGRSLLALHSDQLHGRAIFSHEDTGVATTGHSRAGVQAVHYVVPAKRALHASPWIVARRPCSRAKHTELRKGRPQRARPTVPAHARPKERWLHNTASKEGPAPAATSSALALARRAAIVIQ